MGVQRLQTHVLKPSKWLALVNRQSNFTIRPKTVVWFTRPRDPKPQDPLAWNFTVLPRYGPALLAAASSLVSCSGFPARAVPRQCAKDGVRGSGWFMVQV